MERECYFGPDDPARFQFAVLGLVMQLTALAVEVSVALLAGRAGAWFRRSAGARNWLERASAAILIVIGLRLILLERPDPAPVHP